MKPEQPCPCGLAVQYRDCCGRWHAGAPAPDAQTLMRARYSAYVLGLRDYLLASWHVSTRPSSLELPAPGALRWLGLALRAHRVVDSSHAEVEFVARSRAGGGPATRLHELSRFVLENGRWYYLDGDIR